MKEKQIEEMACGNCLHHFACLVNSEYVPTPCPAYEDKEGYRKQSEGKWIEGKSLEKCSICGKKGFPDWKFCPNCGAKMKGGEG